MKDLSDLKRLPGDPAVNWLGRHLVAYAVLYKTTHGDGSVEGPQWTLYSGFVVELNGMWWWITAGHCFREDIDTLFATDGITVQSAGFVDYLGDTATHFHLVPHEYTPGEAIYLYDKQRGIDFGILPLETLEERLFQQNGVTPVERTQWASQLTHSFEEFEFFRILGIPRECHFSETMPDGRVRLRFRTMLLPVTHTNPKDVDNLDSDKWFIGRIPDDIDVSDIKGMSGGPVFGFWHDAEGKLRYHVVALQSWWRPDERLLFACNLPALAATLESALLNAFERMQAEGSGNADSVGNVE